MNPENCSHFNECSSSSGFGIGCYNDELSSACGGKPWQECWCGIEESASFTEDQYNNIKINVVPATVVTMQHIKGRKSKSWINKYFTQAIIDNDAHFNVIEDDENGYKVHIYPDGIMI